MVTGDKFAVISKARKHGRRIRGKFDKSVIKVRTKSIALEQLNI